MSILISRVSNLNFQANQQKAQTRLTVPVKNDTFTRTSKQSKVNFTANLSADHKKALATMMSGEGLSPKLINNMFEAALDKKADINKKYNSFLSVGPLKSISILDEIKKLRVPAARLRNKAILEAYKALDKETKTVATGFEGFGLIVSDFAVRTNKTFGELKGAPEETIKSQLSLVKKDMWGVQRVANDINLYSTMDRYYDTSKAVSDNAMETIIGSFPNAVNEEDLEALNILFTQYLENIHTSRQECHECINAIYDVMILRNPDEKQLIKQIKEGTFEPLPDPTKCAFIEHKGLPEVDEIEKLFVKMEETLKKFEESEANKVK